MEHKVINTQKFTNKIKVTTQYYKQDSNITLQEVHDLLEQIEHQAEQENKKGWLVMVTALAIDKWTTLKGLHTNLVTLDEYDEYLVNKVMDTTKFETFLQIHISTIEEI